MDSFSASAIYANFSGLPPEIVMSCLNENIESLSKVPSFQGMNSTQLMHLILSSEERLTNLKMNCKYWQRRNQLDDEARRLKLIDDLSKAGPSTSMQTEEAPSPTSAEPGSAQGSPSAGPSGQVGTDSTRVLSSPGATAGSIWAEEMEKESPAEREVSSDEEVEHEKMEVVEMAANQEVPSSPECYDSPKRKIRQRNLYPKKAKHTITWRPTSPRMTGQPQSERIKDFKSLLTNNHSGNLRVAETLGLVPMPTEYPDLVHTLNSCGMSQQNARDAALRYSKTAKSKRVKAENLFLFLKALDVDTIDVGEVTCKGEVKMRVLASRHRKYLIVCDPIGKNCKADEHTSSWVSGSTELCNIEFHDANSARLQLHNADENFLTLFEECKVKFAEQLETIDPNTQLIDLLKMSGLWNDPENLRITLDWAKTVQPAEMSDFSVEQSGTNTIMRFALQETVGIRRSGVNVISMPRDELGKIPHEFVCHALFGQESDTKLSELWVNHDASDRMSPDAILPLDPKRVAVIEVKTTGRGGNCDAAYDTAILKYQPFIESRRDKLYRVRKVTVRQFGIAVSHDRVVTNLPLSDEILDSVVRAYKLGQMILDELKSRGLVTSTTGQEAELMGKISDALRKINIPRKSENKKLITDEMAKGWDDNFSLDFVKKVLKDEFNCCLTEEQSMEEKSKAKVKKLMEHNEEHRLDMKAPVQLPFLVVKDCFEAGYKLSDLDFFDRSTPLSKLWSDVSSAYMEARENFTAVPIINEAGEPEEWVKRSLEPPNITKKYLAKRILLDVENKEYFAKCGVDGKRLKNAIECKIQNEKAKIPFSWICSTEDISRFVNDPTWFEGVKNNPYFEYTEDYIKKAAEYTQDPLTMKNLQVVKQIMKMKIFNSLALLDEMVQELNYSRAANCRKDQFILKKMKLTDAWMLIKPTQADNHIFFSLCVKRDSNVEPYSLPFKLSQSTEKYWVYDFVSTDCDRIDQLIFAPMKALTLLVRQAQLFGNTLSDCLNITPIIGQHFLAELMFMLEDKRQTSSNVQQFRYIYNEVLKGTVKIDPYKVVGKITKYPRSRLLIWAVNRMMVAIDMMCKKRPTIGRKKMKGGGAELSEDVTRNLISWVSLEELPSFESAIELSYYCNLHNKSRKNTHHDEVEIIKKILEEESTMHDLDDDSGLGWEDKEKPKDHEFSHSFVTYCARAAKKKMCGGMSEDLFDSLLTEEILKKLKNVTMLDLATTKSSANGLSREKQQSAVEPRGKESVKCLEAAKKMIELYGTNYPFTVMDKILKDMELGGGLLANLFPKEQIGGAREIFRLEMRARIMMKMLETIATCVDERLENAMLTKPEKKHSRSFDHYYQLRDKLDSGVTGINSTDCKRWAQNFVMPVFACTFKTLLPKALFAPFAASLNMITEKRIELPLSIINRFLANPNYMNYDENVMRLKEEFFGISKRKMIFLDRPYSRMLRNQSNMMQGQTHFVSDVHHACYMIGIEEFCKSLVYSLPLENGRLGTLITTKVSSDDSSVIVTVFPRGKQNDLKATKDYCLSITNAICWMFAKLYPQGGMRYSYEKSTIANMNLIEEFNSIWLLRNTILSAPLKFIYAAMQIPAATNFEMKLYESQSLLTSLFENSGSTQLCSIVQICQAICHYGMLGALTNSEFDTLASPILDKPHPICGFFPLQQASVCGMMPMEYTKYVLCRNSEFSRKTEFWLHLTGAEEYHTEYGTVCTLRIGQGQEKKYLEFKKRMDVDAEDLNKIIREHNSWPFTKPSGKEDTIFHLKCKVLSPGMSDALMFRKLCKIHTTSAYIFTHPCVFKSLKEGGIQKMNMFHFNTEFDPQAVLPEECMSMMFDKAEVYESINSFSENEKYVAMHHKIRKRFVKTTIHAGRKGTTISLQSAVEHTWLGEISHSVQYLKQSWAYYKAVYPWLEDSMQKTLDNAGCPFKTELSLCNFIKSRENRTVSIRSYCCGRVMSSVIDTIKSIATYSYWPATKLVEQKEVEGDANECLTEDFNLIRSQLCLVEEGPQRDSDKDNTILNILGGLSTKMLDAICLNEDEEKIRILGSVVKSQAIADRNQKQLAVNTIRTVLSSCTFAVIGSWTQLCRRVGSTGKYQGSNVWKGHVGGLQCEMYFTDCIVDKIVFDKSRKSTVSMSGFMISKAVKALNGVAPENTGRMSQMYLRGSEIMFQKTGMAIPIEFNELTYEPEMGEFKLHIDHETKKLILTQGSDTVMTYKLAHYVMPKELKIPNLSFEGKDTEKVMKKLGWLLEPWFKGQPLKLDTLMKHKDVFEGEGSLSKWLKEMVKEQLGTYLGENLNLSTSMNDSLNASAYGDALDFMQRIDPLTMPEIEDIVSSAPVMENAMLPQLTGDNEQDLDDLLQNLAEINLRIPSREESNLRTIRTENRTFRNVRDDMARICPDLYLIIKRGWVAEIHPPHVVSILKSIGMPEGKKEDYGFHETGSVASGDEDDLIDVVW